MRDKYRDTSMANLASVNIYLNTMPYDKNTAHDDKFLVTAIAMSQNGPITEYRITLMGDYADDVSPEAVNRIIRTLHGRGLYKRAKKIVSYIEHHPQGDGFIRNAYDQQPPCTDLFPPRGNFNFMI